MLPDMDIGVRGHPLSQDVMDGPEPVTSSRILETLQRYPAYVIPLATLTAAFLVVDLAFAARLLDTTGGSISEQQLGALEAWGWGLGGVALMLLVWGSFILPRGSRNEWSMRRKGIAFVLSAIVSLETVYLVGPALTGRLEDRATAMRTTMRCAASRARSGAPGRCCANHAACHPVCHYQCAVHGLFLRQPAPRFAQWAARGDAGHGVKTNRYSRAAL